MKKALAILMISAAFLLLFTGCNPFAVLDGIVEIAEDSIPHYIGELSLQHEDAEGIYRLFFALYNEDREPVAADTDADIVISDENGNILFEGTRHADQEDFGYYTNGAGDEMFLAEIVISEPQLKAGQSSGGTVSITARCGSIEFPALTDTVIMGLPVLPVEVVLPPLPLTVQCDSYSGSPAEFRIDSVEYETETDIMPRMKLTVKGEMTAGDAIHGMLYCRLTDEEGYLIDTGPLFLTNVKKGDKFADDSCCFYDIVPGTTYFLEIAGDDADLPDMPDMPDFSKDKKAPVITGGELPCEIYGGYGQRNAKYRIDSVEAVSDGYSLYLRVSGEKLTKGEIPYGDTVNYKIIDSEGYVISTETLMLDKLSVGDKFRAEGYIMAELDIEEAYTVEFIDPGE